MRKINSKYTTNHISEKGHSPYNKDYFAYVELDNTACWVLIEAYDNDIDNQSAALAAETIITQFEENPRMTKRQIKKHIKQAHKKLKDYSVKTQLKASITIIISNYTKLIYATCGNTKLTIIREGNIIEKSQDQSLYQNMINEGKIADDGEEQIEENTNLYQYLGKPGTIKPKISKKIPLKPNDLILLTTSGLWEKVSTIETLDALENSKSEENLLENLQELVLSHQNETIRSYTGVIIKAEKPYIEKDNKKKTIKYITIGILITLLLTTIILMYIYIANKTRTKTIETIKTYEQQGDTYIEDTNYDKAKEEYINAITETEKVKTLIYKKDKETPKIKDKLNTKKRITELITEGTESYNNSDYNKAIESLKKAREIIIKENLRETFSLTNIDELLNEANIYQSIQTFLTRGEEQTEAEEYEIALGIYEDAQWMTLTLKETDKKEEIKTKIKEKIKETNKTKTEKHKEKITELAEAEETQAEQTQGEGNIELARNHYNNAYEYYESISDEANKQKIKTKLKELKAEEIIKNQETLTAEADQLAEWGDLELEQNNYEAAKENYKQAKRIYITANQRDIASTMDTKINQVETARKEAQVEEKEQEIARYIEEGQRLEEKGDKALEKNNLETAKAYYDIAKENYKTSGEYMLVQALNQKYDKITEKRAEQQANQQPDQPTEPATTQEDNKGVATRKK